MISRVGTGPRPWRARLRLRGVQEQKSFRTRAEAEEWERDQRETYARERAGLPVQRGPIRYDALAKLYLDGYTAKSKAWFEGRLQHSRDRWGQVYVHLLRPEQIAAWLHSELDLSPKGKQHVLTAMRQVLNAGVEWSYLRQSPVRSAAVKAPKQEAPDVRPLESWAEVLKVADAAGPHYSPLIRFACATGLRPQEWASLEWSDIDRERGVMNVRGTKTDSARRAVVLSKLALDALSDTAQSISTPLVFRSPTGRPIKTKKWGQKTWRKALAVAGLAHRPSYQMRHTYATLALAEGIPLEWISGQMGHATIDITRKHYARFVKRVDDRMRALLNQMEETDAPEALRE